MNWDDIWSMPWLDTLRNDTWDSAVLHVFIIIFLTALANYVARRVLKRLEVEVAQRTKNPWDDTFVAALPPPLAVILWATGIRIALVVTTSEGFSSSFLNRSYFVITVLAAVWFVVRWVVRIEDAMIVLSHEKEEEFHLDPTTVHALGKLLRLSVALTGVLVCLQSLDIDVSAVLAFGGIGGIAIGFAAKDLLSNFFGGLMIYMDRPFKVGDWIRSPDRNVEGTVEYIGWRLTRIRTFDKRPLYVPNAIFATIAIENPQRMLNRRIYETIGIRYDDVDKMGKITEEVDRMLAEHPEIDHEQLRMVYFNAFAASSCDFFVYTFTETTVWKEYHRVKHDVLLKISQIITSHGAEIAYPTSTLHIASAPEPAARLEKQ